MEKKSFFSQHFDDEGGDGEELLKLSLSTSTSLPSSLPFTSNPNPKKRLFSQSFDGEEDHQESHNLSLSIGPPGPSSSSLPPVPSTAHGERSLINSPSPNSNPNPVRQGVSTGSARYPRRTLNPGKSETIEAPYPWATTRRATVHSLDHLLSNGIRIISGEIECKECRKPYKIEYRLEETFKKIKDFISANKLAMNQRAPDAWMNPRLVCRSCTSIFQPVINKKRKINWLFLLLGQMLGCCTVDHLKYFCKHSMNPMTGTKDRLLYLTYLGLCKQLDPHGPFDV